MRCQADVAASRADVIATAASIDASPPRLSTTYAWLVVLSPSTRPFWSA